jgi:hypothetical protein
MRDIVSKAIGFNQRIAKLKAASKYYPKILQVCYDGDSKINFMGNNVEEDVFLSTLVRIEREGVWYTIHVVEAMTFNCNRPRDILYETFMRRVYDVQHLYNINLNFQAPDGSQGFDIDKLQISEEERLKQRP